MIKELLNTIAGNALDRIGSFRVEEGFVGGAIKYGRYDRQTGERIGEELFISGDGFTSQVYFYRSSDLRKKYLNEHL